jgi:enoyl-CoA hydratase/carnithine racemase
MSCPEKRNALSEQMLLALADTWERFNADDDAWVAILTGEGKVFCSGADMSFFKQTLEGEEFNNKFLGLVNKNPFMTGKVMKPTIAALNGAAIGGGVELALRADFRISVDDAIMLMPESELGNVLLLWEGLPYAVAKEMVCGFPLSAKRSYELGLFNRIVPCGQALEAAIEFAGELLRKPPLTIRKNIQLMNELKNMDAPMPRQTLLDYCAQLSNTLSATEDSKTAMAAFIQKTKPVYYGK